MTAREAAARAYALMLEIDRDARGNPLALEGVIRSVILKHPDTFQYRDDALGVIYCVLGTGVRWIDGRLGDAQPNNDMNLPPDEGRHQGFVTEDHGFAESVAGMGDIGERLARQFQNEREARQRAAIETIDRIDERCQQLRPDGVSWYPISWYGCNLCAPADARPDFRDGAVETATLIVRCRPTPGTERWVVHQRTKRYAEQILAALQQDSP